MGVVGDPGPGELEGCAMMGWLTKGASGPVLEEVGSRVSVAKLRGKASGELERRKGGLEGGKRVHELQGCEARGGGGEKTTQRQGSLVGREGA